MLPKFFSAGAITMAALLANPSDEPGLVQQASLTLDGARRVAAAAEAYAKSNGAAGAIAVVDPGGNLIHLARLDGTFPAAANVSIGKARTAALFQRPTSFFEQVVNEGRTSMTALPDFTPLQGGVPIVVDGQVVGAIGVSGAKSAKQDDEIAVAAADYATGLRVGLAGEAALEVQHVEREVVDAAFQRGAPLIENEHFKVHASRRERPGEAEVHALDTDIVYVVDGKATLVTGGEVLEPRTVAPNETRGTGISGGTSRALERGDVVVIPAGTPHWFREVPASFTYYVVKAH